MLYLLGPALGTQGGIDRVNKTEYKEAGRKSTLRRATREGLSGRHYFSISPERGERSQEGKGAPAGGNSLENQKALR